MATGYYSDTINRIQYQIEAQGSYATNLSGSTTYKDIRVLDGASFELNVEMKPNNTMAQRLDRMQKNIKGRRRSGNTFSSYLNGTGVVASKGVIGVTSSNGDMLKTIMGGEHLTTGSGVTSVTDAGRFVVDGQANDLLYAGTVIGLLNPTSSLFETSRIQSYNTSTNTINLANQLNHAPASGSTVYGGSTYFLRQDPDTSLQFYVQGDSTNKTFVLMGLQGGFGLKTEIGELATIDYKLEGGADWNSGSTGDLALANYPEANPVAAYNSFVCFYPKSSTATTAASRTQIHVQSVEVTPNIKYNDITSYAGSNNIAGKKRARSVPIVQGKLTAYFTDHTYPVARDNTTLYGLHLQIGSEAGKTVSIVCPSVQIINAKQVNGEGTSCWEIEWIGHEDEVATTTGASSATITDMAASALVISFN
jgi:hypothetical protein